MRRSLFITSDQLKGSWLILVALLILGCAALKRGHAGNRSRKRYRRVSFGGNARGLRSGDPFTVAGQLAVGSKYIQSLPPDADTPRNLKLIVEVNYDLRD